MEELREQLAAADAVRLLAENAAAAAAAAQNVAENNAATAATAQAAADAAAAQATADLALARAATAAAVLQAAGPTTFALSPALASTTMLNYRSSEGIKIYGKATAPLDVLFDGDSGALRLFLSKVQQRAIQFGWTAILTVNQAGQNHNILSSYGQVTTATIQGNAIIWEAAQDRNTQNSSQMYTFLISSVTDGLLGKVISQKDEYTSSTGFQDGPSLLKVIITISHVDTRAQAGYIRQCLARLSTTILEAEYGCDIQKINEYVVVLEEGLAARGESSQDTLMNVHAAYMACKDADFVRHAKDEYAKWEQGATMTLKEYMGSCLTKFKTLKMKGLWEAPSPEQEQIIALTAAVTSLKAKAGKPGKPKPKVPNGGEGNEQVRHKHAGKFAWKDHAPKSGEPTSKIVQGKTYYWCTHHKNPMWALHNPNSFPNLCRGHPKFAEMEAAFKKKGGSEPTASDITLQAALAALSDDESDGEGDDEE
jgi:hypothetical protein